MINVDIDITDLTAREIVRILELYPQGRLLTKSDRIFWSSSQLEPTHAVSPVTQRNTVGAGFNFQRAADVLGSMMGPPTR